MSRFFAYISRMKHIKRWGLMPSFREENIQEHSLQVAMFAHALALIQNKRYNGHLDPEHVMALAVYHETAEVITGDLVTPIKYYNEEIRSAYKKIEKEAEERMISMLPEDLKEDYRPLIQPSDPEEKLLVKAADKIAAYTKCLEERRSGNMEFIKAEQQLYDSIMNMKLPAVEDFMRECIPEFNVTLDELNEH
ncbi:MAG: 5'-deoxynucleotidase [Lachnospiraceae bacterium]|nr:5'-deoxynucleotidase [Lachnospiraceae bacterium]